MTSSKLAPARPRAHASLVLFACERSIKGQRPKQPPRGTVLRIAPRLLGIVNPHAQVSLLKIIGPCHTVSLEASDGSMSDLLVWHTDSGAGMSRLYSDFHCLIPLGVNTEGKGVATPREKALQKKTCL